MADTLCDDRPLTFEDLVAWFAEGGKPPADFKVGAEHEKFVFHTGDNAPVPYDGEAGIKALMEGLMRFGWEGVYETGGPAGETLIGLSRGKANVSLEPGGQFELSGAPLHTMHDICEETGQHLEEAKTVAAELGLGFLGLGFTPLWRRDEVPVMPKGRYKIMRNYMPKVGGKGLDMMFPHLHRPSKSRFRRRGRHGGQVPRQPGPAADRHRLVRQFAVHRRAAQRLPFRPRRRVGPTPTKIAREC